MESSQVVAAVIAGFVAPFVQEILLGAKLSGRLAVLASVGVTFVIATFAHWATGGFGGAEAIPAFNTVDPSAFFSFWWKLWTPVFVLSKLVHGTLTTYSKSTGEAKGPIQDVADKVAPVIGTDK